MVTPVRYIIFLVKTLRPAFLSAEGIVLHDHGLKEQGAVALQKLLIVIECVRPEIRYVPVCVPRRIVTLAVSEELLPCPIPCPTLGHLSHPMEPTITYEDILSSPALIQLLSTQP